MDRAMKETDRRRAIQEKYNQDNNITPTTIKKEIRAGLESEITARKTEREVIHMPETQYEQEELANMLEKEMLDAAETMDFERAAIIRDKLMDVRQKMGQVSMAVPSSQRKTAAKKKPARLMKKKT
jgi:excinuclease ABC subunit B